jgi:hypothetical protein
MVPEKDRVRLLDMRDHAREALDFISGKSRSDNTFFRGARPWYCDDAGSWMIHDAERILSVTAPVEDATSCRFAGIDATRV